MARINRSHVRRLEEAAHEDAVRIPQRDGSVKLFDRMHVAGQIFLAQLDAGLGRPRRPSDVMDAVDHAPNEIRMRILREHSGSFMGDLDPADPAEGRRRTSPSKRRIRPGKFVGDRGPAPSLARL